MGYRMVKRLAFRPCPHCGQGGITTDMDDEQGRDTRCLLCGARFPHDRAETIEERATRIEALSQVAGRRRG